ncbi:MAG: DNA primase [Pseudomonadota bacterium]
MSLPPGFLDELRSRVSIGQVVGRKVMWDQRKSNQGKGDLWAPCPFHQEKTASFHVDDRKGYYYCFGCHAKGDALTFVRETENVGFMEAVEILAGEVGMQMPAPDPKAREKADRRTQLSDVMEKAVQYFRLQFKTGAAAKARDYLAGRGISDAAIDRWEIGFAPPGWQGLWDHLKVKGIADDLILGAGLAKPSNQSGKPPYDTFRDRIMYPIRDARGRPIAFGGRAMDPNDNAKYLNSPETELFDKGRNLYNHGPAREAAGKGQPLVVAEGYMDVIALSEAGFGGAVAALGTAITEDQLQLMWRISPEPILALDGDAAGLRAAMRLIDLALPLIGPDKSLRFALLPEGVDPDDLIRTKGAGAMRDLLDSARPLISLLWQRETDGLVLDSPERRAALDASLRAALQKIADRSVRDHYAAEIRRLRSELFAPDRSAGRTPYAKGGRRTKAENMPSAAARQSMLAKTPEAEDRLREAVVLAVLVRNPGLIEEFESDLERMEVSSPEARLVQDALLRSVGAASEEFLENLDPAALEKLTAPRHVAIQLGVRVADEEVARLCLAEEFAKLSAWRGARAEIEEAVRSFDDLADEGLTWRVSQAAEARERAGQSASKDRTDYDTGSNGARLRRDEKSAFDALLKEIGLDGGPGS